MSGSTFGTLFRVTNFGESHGPAIGCVIDGCPPGMALSEADIQPDLDRRRPGTSRHVTQRNEPDTVEILSGVYEGVTTGTPICLLIRNTDQRSNDYGNILDTFRPGHADYTYWQQVRPARSARRRPRIGAPHRADGRRRRSGAQVAAAKQHGTRFRGCMRRSATSRSRSRAGSTCRTTRSSHPTSRRSRSSKRRWTRCARRATRSARASASWRRNVPVGLGEPLFDKLDADIAYAMMGINAVKGVEIGAGFARVAQRGGSTATS